MTKQIVLLIFGCVFITMGSLKLFRTDAYLEARKGFVIPQLDWYGKLYSARGGKTFLRFEGLMLILLGLIALAGTLGG